MYFVLIKICSPTSSSLAWVPSSSSVSVQHVAELDQSLLGLDPELGVEDAVEEDVDGAVEHHQQVAERAQHQGPHGEGAETGREWSFVKKNSRFTKQ